MIRTSNKSHRDADQVMRHTPGPWDYDMDYIVAPDPNGIYPDIYIAEIVHDDEEGRVATCPQQDANRRLIAAAPELLELARQIIWAWTSQQNLPAAIYHTAAHLVAKTSLSMEYDDASSAV